MRLFIAAFAGAIFGIGLLISGMADPMIVLGFFDILGDWNPRLAFVMAGAVPVMALAWWFARRRDEPLGGGAFPEPASPALDAKLIGGSVLFGIGWGITGLCPAPSIAALGLGGEGFQAFVAALLLGLMAPSLLDRERGRNVAA